MTELFLLAGYLPCMCSDTRICRSCHAWAEILETFPDYRLPTIIWEDQ